MRMRKGLSLLTAAAACGIGILAGSAMSQRPGQAASANAAAPAQQPPDDGKLRIIVFGAHPDDAEFVSAGVAMKWARAGHHVKLVSTTNGDIGHWQMAGGPLAMRRTKEVEEVARRLGVTVEVLDIHDGEIMPTLENRRLVTRLIRQWKADVVITHRPNDYHPDHRYTSLLVQDSAYMVTVPFWCPDATPLQRNPVFLYSSDRFQTPTPFRADVAIAVDEVIEPMVHALMAMESQLHEGGANGHAGLFPPGNEAARQKRREAVRAGLIKRYAAQADRFRPTLVKFYGEESGKKVRYAQAFEICEYGRQPSQEELRKIFPF
jgi:N-acetylglucosamine malate deacetylase 1